MLFKALVRLKCSQEAYCCKMSLIIYRRIEYLNLKSRKWQVTWYIVPFIFNIHVRCLKVISMYICKMSVYINPHSLDILLCYRLDSFFHHLNLSSKSVFAFLVWIMTSVLVFYISISSLSLRIYKHYNISILYCIWTLMHTARNL